MCGIAGVIAGEWSPEAAGDRVRQMIARLRHRGPDAEGIWQARCSAGWVTLGHRRLSVIDLSPAANQPMIAADGQTALVFNGEIYNFRELRDELATQYGVAFRTATDSEIVLAGYRVWGETVLDRLVGMFAFAIWDGPAEKLFLARDRAGEKPLYVAHTAAGLAFASEIAALTDWPGLSGMIDRQAVAQFLATLCVPAPATIWHGISKLPAAHAMRWHNQRLTTWRYWNPADFVRRPRMRVTHAAAVDRLHALVRQSVRQQMVADVPLGAFLSGGIDSSTIAAVMQECAAEPIRTFTIGFDVPGFDESPHAEAVAKHLGTQHITERLTAQMALDLIPRLPAIYGEPFADASALPTHLISQITRRHVTVALTGDGGDELFGGYHHHARMVWLPTAVKLAGMLSPLAKPILRRLPPKFRRAEALLGESPVGMYQAARATWGWREIARLMEWDAAAPPAITAAIWGPEFRWVPNRRRAMLADLQVYLADELMVKIDRASMAVSLETRAPLLDHRVMEFALQLPTRLVRRKRLLKSLAYRCIPRAILDRPKMGFSVPLRHWLRGPLHELLGDLLSPSHLAAVGIFNSAAVAQTVAEHAHGTFDHSNRLWALLMLTLWHTHQKPLATVPETAPRPT